MKPKERINNLKNLLKRYLDTNGHSPNDTLDKFVDWANRDDNFIAAISIHGLLFEDKILLDNSWEEVYNQFEKEFIEWVNKDPTFYSDWLPILPDRNAWGNLDKEYFSRCDAKELFDTMVFYLDQCQEFRVLAKDTGETIVHVFIDECPVLHS